MSEHVIDTDDQGFEATVLQANVPVLVDFWATWCTPCKMLSPIVEELAGEYQGQLQVVKINADENQDVVSRYGVQSLPSLLFFKDGQVVDRLIGAWPKAKVATALKDVLAIPAASHTGV